jgi:hypothetical protein
MQIASLSGEGLNSGSYDPVVFVSIQLKSVMAYMPGDLGIIA